MILKLLAVIGLMAMAVVALGLVLLLVGFWMDEPDDTLY